MSLLDAVLHAVLHAPSFHSLAVQSLRKQSFPFMNHASHPPCRCSAAYSWQAAQHLTGSFPASAHAPVPATAPPSSDPGGTPLPPDSMPGGSQRLTMMVVRGITTTRKQQHNAHTRARAYPHAGYISVAALLRSWLRCPSATICCQYQWHTVRGSWPIADKCFAVDLGAGWRARRALGLACTCDWRAHVLMYMPLGPA